MNFRLEFINPDEATLFQGSFQRLAFRMSFDHPDFALFNASEFEYNSKNPMWIKIPAPAPSTGPTSAPMTDPTSSPTTFQTTPAPTALQTSDPTLPPVSVDAVNSKEPPTAAPVKTPSGSFVPSIVWGIAAVAATAILGL